MNIKPYGTSSPTHKSYASYTAKQASAQAALGMLKSNYKKSNSVDLSISPAAYDMQSRANAGGRSSIPHVEAKIWDPHSEESLAEKKQVGIDKRNARYPDFKHHDNGMNYNDYYNAVMNSVGNGHSIQVKPAESIDERTQQLMDKISTILDHEGIKLNDNESFDITISGDRFIVSGLEDAEKQTAIEEALNQSHIIGKDYFYHIGSQLRETYYLNSDYAKEAESYEEAKNRGSLIELKNTAADAIKKQTGVDVDLSKFYRDDDGKIKGYPEELAWIFEGDYSLYPKTAAEKEAYSVASAVKNIVNRLVNAGYDNIPDIGTSDVKFSYSNKELQVH